MENKSFSISGALREGWELTKVNIVFLIGYQVILFFLIWLFNHTEDNDWRFSPIQLIGLIITSLANMGFYHSALLLTKGLKPRFSEFYSNWRLFFSWIIAGFLYGFMLGIGLLLLIVPGLYVFAIFGFYPFFILDKGSGPIESLKKSAEITKGIRNHVVLFFLACLGIIILGLLCFGVGLLIAAPVVIIAMASVYEKLTNQSKTSIQPDDIFP